jgi:CrcB protein
VIGVGVAVAGALGAVTRYVVDLLVTRWTVSDLPWGTAVINITGSFLAGMAVGLLARGVLNPSLAVVLAGGYLGAYTTFSTAMYETARLVEERASVAAVANLVLPLVMSVAAASVGWWLGTG